MPLLAVLVATFELACSGKVGRVEWNVMGTVAAIQWQDHRVDEMQPVIDEAKNLFRDVESLLNAHDQESEMCRLAHLPDLEILSNCNTLVRACYECAFCLRDSSGNVFNPRYRGPGTMDLGAIAKGFAVDLVSDRINAGFPHIGNVLVDLGGNLKSVGGTWSVGVAHGDGMASVPEIPLTNCMACATSGEYYRGKHILDGRTGGMLSNTVYSVTVVHPTSAMMADGLSTIMFIMGKQEGTEFLRRTNPDAYAVWVPEK